MLFLLLTYPNIYCKAKFYEKSLPWLTHLRKFRYLSVYFDVLRFLIPSITIKRFIKLKIYDNFKSNIKVGKISIVSRIIMGCAAIGIIIPEKTSTIISIVILAIVFIMESILNKKRKIVSLPE